MSAIASSSPPGGGEDTEHDLSQVWQKMIAGLGRNMNSNEVQIHSGHDYGSVSTQHALSILMSIILHASLSIQALPKRLKQDEDAKEQEQEEEQEKQEEEEQEKEEQKEEQQEKQEEEQQEKQEEEEQEKQEEDEEEQEKQEQKKQEHKNKTQITLVLASTISDCKIPDKFHRL